MVELGYVDGDTVTRVVVGANGLMIAWFGNRMPKVVAPSACARQVAWVGGWSMVLSGLVYAGLWAFAPIPVAIAGGCGAGMAGIAVILGYCLWLRPGRRPPRAAFAARQPGVASLHLRPDPEVDAAASTAGLGRRRGKVCAAMTPQTMRAVRVARFGGPDVIQVETVPVPSPGPGEVLVRVEAAGVGPWDGWIRSGRSVLDQPLPLTLGSDIAGRVEAVGDGVSEPAPGTVVYGVTNGRFTGGYADYALCEADRVARKPASLSEVEAASAPVVSVTAWQMLFEAARLEAGRSVLVHGALGSVGRYAVQLGRNADLQVFATARPGEEQAMSELGLAGTAALGAGDRRFDAALDLVGGESQARLFPMLSRGGVLVSAVAEPDAELARAHEVEAKFILVDVRARILGAMADLFDQGRLRPWVGTVLPLTEAATAHRMLDGETPRPPGKIVLTTA